MATIIPSGKRRRQRCVSSTAKLTAAALAAGILASGCSLPGERPRETRGRILMDTLVELQVPRDAGKNITEAAFEEFARVEKKYAPSKGEFGLKSAGERRVVLDEETLYLIGFALKISRMSGGALDPSIGALTRLWKKPPAGREPSEKEISDALRESGAKHIGISGNELLKKPGTQIDFGAFVKGYAADRAAGILKSSGLREGLINAGGDIRAFGPKTWRIAVRHPRKEGEFLGVIPLKNRAVATSGDYERFTETGGRKYHHIINPSTGRPAEGVMSATVAAADCMTADALATAVFVLGAEKGVRLVESFAEADCVVVDSEGGIYVSAGFKKIKFVY